MYIIFQMFIQIHSDKYMYYALNSICIINMLLFWYILRVD